MLGLQVHGNEELWALGGWALFFLVIIAIVIYKLDQKARAAQKAERGKSKPE
jgi:hypothetical protein